MAKTLGLVNLHSTVTYGGLTERRPVASVSYLGRYAIIDIVLSNMSNSGIDSVGILIQNNPRSLFKHIGHGNGWNFNTKKGGMSLLYNEKYANNLKYNHDINNLVENIAFIKDNMPDYVVIAPCHIVTTMNYNDVIDAHIASGADITVVYKHIEDADTAYIGSDYLKMTGNKIDEFKVNKGNKKERDISLETYVINTPVLMDLIDYATHLSSFYNLRDTLAYLADERTINAYEYKGYARCLDSMEHYMEYSLEMLDLDVSTQVFKSNWPIYTRTNDTPPTKYKEHAKVTKSFVANGAIIDGKVEGSIIGREVKIGTGATVINSIIFSNAVIDEGAYLENVIVDKKATVSRVKDLSGTKASPLYIKEGDNV